jgi:hypothetical protein
MAQIVIMCSNWADLCILVNDQDVFWNVGNKHCPIQLIKKKVSGFLGGNRAKTDTNGTKPPNNRQHTPKATQDPQSTPSQPGYQYKPHTHHQNENSRRGCSSMSSSSLLHEPATPTSSRTTKRGPHHDSLVKPMPAHAKQSTHREQDWQLRFWIRAPGRRCAGPVSTKIFTPRPPLACHRRHKPPRL